MQGEKITVNNGVLNVPNNPIVPFIEGDGTGPDIWASSDRKSTRLNSSHH